MKKKKIKGLTYKQILIPMLIIFYVDVLSTIIALNFVEGLVEGNPIPAWFFQFGWIGWVTCFILSSLMLTFGAYLIYKIGKKFPLNQWIGMGAFVFIEFLAIINNTTLIIGKL